MFKSISAALTVFVVSNSLTAQCIQKNWGETSLSPGFAGAAVFAIRADTGPSARTICRLEFRMAAKTTRSTTFAIWSADASGEPLGLLSAGTAEIGTAVDAYGVTFATPISLPANTTFFLLVDAFPGGTFQPPIGTTGDDSVFYSNTGSGWTGGTSLPWVYNLVCCEERCVEANFNPPGHLSFLANPLEFAILTNTGVAGRDMYAIDLFCKASAPGDFPVSIRSRSTSSGLPDTRLGGGTMSVGSTPDAYRTTFAAPVSLPAGTDFFITLDNFSQTLHLPISPIGIRQTHYYRTSTGGWAGPVTADRWNYRIDCTPPAPDPAPPMYRVMLLGDSITEARNGYATYRYFLWKKLLAAGRCVDFVGSMRGTQGRRGIGHDGIPKYTDFDQDHEGHWDFRADQLADQAFRWATAANPELVIMHAGSVDLWYGQDAPSTVADIGRIIDELRRANPDIVILLAKIIPFAPKWSIDVGPVNALLPDLVASKSTPQSPITLIDHYTGWDPVALNIDGVHPNRAGEERMAETWFQAMDGLDLAECRVPKRDVRIMPLGDSVTEARYGYATYRYYLWKQLIASGHCVDFVGSLRGTQSRNRRGHDGKPKYPDFDQDHEGRWDLTADQLAAGAYDWVNAAQPDVVLLFAGSVDLYFRQDVASTVAELGTAIDEIRRAKPDVKILMAKVTPFAAKFNVDVTPLNAELPALVASKFDANSPLILVDHFAGWDPAIHSIDGVHPYGVGEERMANTWHDALLACDLSCEASFDLFGQGCAGTAGTPSLRAQAGTRPLLSSSPFKVDLENLPASANVMGLIGLSADEFAGRTLPILLGTPGCYQLVGADAMIPLQANALGELTWCIDFPSLPSPAIAGLCFFVQATVADGAITTVSNAGAARLGAR